MSACVHPANPSNNSFRALVEQAMEELRLKTTVVDGAAKLSTACWAVDQDRRTIQFLWSGGTMAVARVQIIGTYNTADRTWLWAWDNPSIDELLMRDAKKLREYGQKHGFDLLTTRKLECSEEKCWDFAAIACKLCGAQGAYRGPIGNARVFMTFGELKVSKLM